jgi:hypothetical protein
MVRKRVHITGETYRRRGMAREHGKKTVACGL